MSKVSDISERVNQVPGDGRQLVRANDIQTLLRIARYAEDLWDEMLPHDYGRLWERLGFALGKDM